MWRRKLVAYFSLLMVVILLFSEVARAAMPIPPTTAPSDGRSADGSSGSSDVPTTEEELGLPNPFSTAAATSQDDSAGPVVAAADPVVASAPTGRLLFAPAIDVDGDPGTNPAESKAVPVIDLFGHLGGDVILAAQLEADDPNLAPIRIPVTFHVWSDGGFEFRKTVESDVWGAVSLEVPLADVAAEYAYQASAPGYGQTEIRYFRFDSSQTSMKVHNGGAELTYEMGADRWVIFTVTSPVALDAERGDVVTMNLLRRPLPDTLDEIETELSYYVTDARAAAEEAGLMPMPTVLFEIVDSYTARAEVQLPQGDYGVVASLRTFGDMVEFFNSEAKRFQITDQMVLPTPTQAVWISPLEFDPGKMMVLFEGKPGRARFDLVDSANVPPLKDDWDGQTQLVNVWRTGPFEWQKETYNVEVETRVTDGKKVVTLQNFDYDPVAQHYKLAIKSLHETVITDTLTIEVLGPGGVILQQDISQVVLYPNQVFHYTVEVPADLGRPEGIRVTLADPLIEDLRAVADTITRLYQAVSSDGFVRGFVAGFADIFQIKLIEVKYEAPPGKLEVKTDFLDELMRDPWTALLRLANGALDSVNMFNISWFDLWDFVTGDTEAFNKILRALSIDLGGLGIEAGVELGVDFTADFGDCPDDADVKALEERLKEIAYSMNEQLAGDAINAPFPLNQFRVPLYGPLTLAGLVIRVRLGGEIDASGLTMTFSGQFSIGAEARLMISFDFNIIAVIKDLLAKFNPNDPRLKTVGWFAAAEVFRRATGGLLKWLDYYQIINDIMNIQIPNGNCDPDPPDPRPPDDRQDVWQGVDSFYQGGTHEETISNLNALLERAEAQNLDRAERFLTLRLRQAESARFGDDTDKYLGYLSDSFDVLLASDIDVLNILTGTTPLSPTQTMTDAVTSRVFQAQSELDNLAYAVEQRQIQDALAVAQRRYDELIGQELELQHELRQLFTADVVGVLASGFAESTLSALSAMGIPSQLISPWPSAGDFRGRPAAYVPPPLAPRALVVPSGGLHAIANSVGARDWLEAYVEGGGLLIVFSQAFGTDWSALPGGAMAGVGYEEDQRWQHATVEAGQPSDWLVWMGIERPDVQIDGAFTGWPENANILLRRTFGSFRGSPVMVEYPYGAGTVLATTAYGDWAWQTNFWWGDDARLTHSILIRAYLLGRGQDVADVEAADPSSTVAVSFPLLNTSTFSATTVKLEIPLVWGSGSGSSVANVPLDLGPGQTGVVNASLSTPPVMRGVHDWTQVGLYRLRLTVTTKDGNRYNTWGPFVYVRSPIVPPAVSGSLQVSQNPASLFSTVVVSASLRNYTTIARTVVISDQVALPGGPVSVTVPANSTVEYPYTVFMDGSKNPAVAFYDPNGESLGRATTVVGVAYPQLRATPLVPAALADGSVIPVAVTNSARQGQALAATLAISLTSPSGVLVWSDSVALPPIAAGQTVTPSFTLNGVVTELGTYQLNYRVDDGRNLARSSYIPLPSSLALATGLDRATYRIRENGILTLTLSNSGRFDLTPMLTVSGPSVGLNSGQSLALPVGGRESQSFNFALPDTLAAGSYPIVVGYQVGTQTVTRTLTLVVPESRTIATLSQLEYAAGDTAVIMLNNTGGVDAPVEVTLELMDQYGSIVAFEDVAITVLAGQSAPASLEIPSGVIDGDYLLTLDGENTANGARVAFQANLAVSGLAGALTVQTGQPAYFSDEQISAFADILMTSSTLEDGDLNLRICTPAVDDPGGGFTQPPRINYTNQSIPFNWIDIASGGTLVARGSNTFTQVNLGFTFDYYGTAYTQMFVSSNGYVSFGTGSSSSTNGAIPSIAAPNNAVYVLWDSLYPNGGAFGNVFAQQTGPNQYVVQWHNVSHCCSTGSPETFQLILDGTDDSLTMQYLDVTQTDSATVGVENSLGSSAVQIANNQSGIISDNQSLKLTPGQVLVDEINYQSATVPLNWVDIATGGNVVAQANDTFTQIAIGFPFQFYGVTHTQMFVGSNGLLSFGSGNSTGSNAIIPNGSTPNNSIYALWDDLNPSGGTNGNVYVRQLDATRTVVQWQAVSHPSGGTPATFQAILNGSDHSVTLQYLDVGDTSSATVGVENSTGTEAIVIAHNQPGIIVDGLAVKLNAIRPTVADVNYTSAATAYNWIDIASGGNIVAQGNDTYSLVDLGFPFSFHGITYTQMYVDSNGYVTFGGGYTTGFNTSLPSPSQPNNAIYAFWDDLNPSGGNAGLVYAQQTGPTRYVVQWQGVTHCCSNTLPETFQLILDGSDHSVTLQYHTISSAGSATVGMENNIGSEATLLSYNQTDAIANNTAFKLTRGVQLVPETVYNSSAVPLNWRNVAATGTIVAQGDDTYSLVDIGFPFSYYGVTYNQMYVSSNGYVSFGEGYGDYTNDFLPNPNTPNNAIYGLWTDLYPAGGVYGNVYTEQISPTLHVIQWQGVSHCCSTGQPETFQILLDGSDNSVTLQYLDVTDSSGSVVGLENGAGTAAALVSYYDDLTISDGAAFKLVPSQQMVEKTVYSSASVPFVWENVGPADGTQTLTGQNTFMQVELGFPFQFYGLTYTQMFVGSNGFVSFENGFTNSANGLIPSAAVPNNAIYALWDSLYPLGGLYGQVFARQTGPSQYVVQWQQVAHCCSTGQPETFQMILDGSNNTVTLQYEDVTLVTSATAGVENRSGTRATQVSNNQAGILVDGAAFRLTPNTNFVQIASYAPQTVALDWQESAATAGTRVMVGNNTSFQVDLGFPFQFYGITYTQMFVGSNGFVSFGAGSTASANVAIPSTAAPNNSIYALWDALNPVGSTFGHIYGRQTGPTEYVVQWERVTHSGGANPETFQIVLDGSNHTVRLQYEDVALTNSATVGVEEQFGIRATQLAFNQAGIINDGTAYNLTPVLQSVLRPSYLSASQPIAWVDISPAAGTEIIVGSNTFSQVNLGFPFRFYGNTYNSLYVNTNGYLTFGAGSTNGSNGAIPNYLEPNNAIFALWDSLNPTGGLAGQIYARQTGPTQYVVQFERVTHCCSNASPETFQVVLDGSNNTIVLAYEDVALTNSATVGVENEFGTRALQLANNQTGIIVDAMATRLTPAEEPVPPPPICDPTIPQPIDLMLVIDRSGSMSGQAIVDAKAAAIAFVDFLDLGTDRVGLGSFESTARLDVALTHNGDAVKAAINSLIASGGTAIGEGVAVGHSQLVAGATPGVTPVLVLLSDGVNGSGRDPLLAANAAKAEGIKLVTIGLGFGADEALLRAMASTEDDYHFAPSGADLEEIFTSIANSICRSPLPYDASCGGFILWETTVPVTVTNSLNVSELVEPLNLTGQLNLDGRLYAQTGQPLAQDDYPFYLFDRDTAITLETDRDFYRPGQTVHISGVVTNTSLLTVSTDLRVWAGTLQLVDQPITLGPGEAYPYTTTFNGTAALLNPNLNLIATANSASVQRLVIVSAPEVTAKLTAPDVVGRDPFSVTLVISNSGIVPATIEPTLAGQTHPAVTLQPDEFVAVVETLRISQDTLVEANVAGDDEVDLSALVEQGELADLGLAAPAAEVAGLVEVPFTIEGTGQLPATGQLVIEVDGVVVASQTFAAPAGDTVAGAVALELPAGPVEISGRLVDETGDLFDDDAVDAALLAAGAAAVPAVQVTNVTISPSPVSAGSTVSVTIEVENNGAAGPVVVGLQLFDAEQQWIINPDAFESGSFTFSLPVPGDVPADEYFGQLTVDGQSQPIVVEVIGVDVAMSLALDKEFYFPGEAVELTVTLTDRAGVAGDYIVMPRYLVAESYDPITIGANETVEYTFTFTATEAARVNVFLATAGAPPDYERRVLTLDSLPVPVVQPARGAYLTFDQLVYDPGDTIHIEAHVPGTRSNVVVMGPMELAFQQGGFLLWEPPTSENFGLVVTGTYPLSYTLPAPIREGRYTFVVRIDGQNYNFPVDVNGWKVTTRHITLDRPRYAQQDELTAVVEFWNEGDTTIEDLLLTAWVFTPDGGEVLQLSPLVSRTVDLPPGLNVFTVSGAFDTPVVGPHRLLVNLSVPGAGWRVAGASAQFDVGWAHIVELTPSQGSYTPGAAGTANLDVYGYGPTHLVVTATGGQTVLDIQADLSGYETFTFTIPTADIGDYLLIAESTDQNGATDEMIRPYNVPPPADLLPPQISLTYPNTITVLTSAAPTMTITVLGQATDDSGVVQVSVNGQVVTPTAGGSFATPLVLRQGYNVVSASAIDGDGNISFADPVTVYLLPERNVTLAGSPTQALVGDELVFQFTLTASGNISGVSAIQALPAALITDVEVIPESGEAFIVPVPGGVEVHWNGDVPANTPVFVTVSGSAVAEGTLQQSVEVGWGFGFAQTSNVVTIQIGEGEPPETCALYPIALHQSTLAGVPAGTIINDIYNGSGPGNFGWLTWAGDNNTPALIASLTIPGNSHTYVNPYNANDHMVSIGNWVEGRPGVANANAVRDALDTLKGVNIVVPVWDAVEGQGSNVNYHVVGFARIRLMDYQLPGTNEISAKFLGYVNCVGS
jgi:uncharacterized protein YegL